MIQELTASVDQIRNDAQDLRRDARDATDPAEREKLFQAAEDKFQSAIKLLERGLRTARRQQETNKGDVCLLLERLSQSHGSLGGTYRDARKFAQAQDQYDKGNTYEAERRKDCGALDTYNMLQFLVVQLLPNPGLVKDKDFLSKLNVVRVEVERQVNAGRKDSWALADLALVRFLCGLDAHAAIADIERRNVHASFFESTHTAVTSLLKEGLGKDEELGARLEEFRRLLKRKGGIP